MRRSIVLALSAGIFICARRASIPAANAGIVFNYALLLPYFLQFYAMIIVSVHSALLLFLLLLLGKKKMLLLLCMHMA